MDHHNTTDRRCKSWDLGPKVLASLFRFGSYGFGDGQFDSPLAATITCTGEILMWRPKGTRMIMANLGSHGQVDHHMAFFHRFSDSFPLALLKTKQC